MIIASKYQGYCSRCHFTYFKGEHVEWTKGKTEHVDCLEALTDHFPRSLSHKYRKVFGNVSRKKMRVLLETEGPHTPSSNNFKHRANRGVRLIS